MGNTGTADTINEQISLHFFQIYRVSLKYELNLKKVE